MDVKFMKTSWGLAQCQISWFHPTSGTVYLVSDPGWRGGGCQPLLPGPLPLPNLLPGGGPIRGRGSLCQGGAEGGGKTYHFPPKRGRESDRLIDSPFVHDYAI